MNKRKIFRRAVSMMFVVSIMLFAAVTHAEIYTGEGSYVMSEGENLGVSKERAKADAMRNATEKAGVYVKSYSRSKNFELEEDIIETMTANILKLVEDPKFLPYEQLDNLEGLMIRVIVKVQIDDSDINRWLNKDDNEKSTLVSQNEALRKANEEQARIIEDLKRQLANNPNDREQITKKFEAEDKIFLSNQKVEEGWNLWEKKDFNGAKNLFDEAVQLNPDNTQAYLGRGTSYASLKQNERAIQEFDKAIQLNPNYAMAYNNRGSAYIDLKQYDKAIQDLNNAIQINPKFTEAYLNRGTIYSEVLKQYDMAIQDYNKAIELNPNSDLAYSFRAWNYYCLKNYSQAIEDVTKAIQINPNNMHAYLIRRICYLALGDKAKAQADLAKAKELGYKG